VSVDIYSPFPYTRNQYISLKAFANVSLGGLQGLNLPNGFSEVRALHFQGRDSLGVTVFSKHHDSDAKQNR